MLTGESTWVVDFYHSMVCHYLRSVCFEMPISNFCILGRSSLTCCFPFFLCPLSIYCIDFLFQMTRVISKNNAKEHAKKLPIVSGNSNKWKHNGKRTDLSKQRLSLCHIGLEKDHGSHLVSQPPSNSTLPLKREFCKVLLKLVSSAFEIFQVWVFFEAECRKSRVQSGYQQTVILFTARKAPSHADLVLGTKSRDIYRSLYLTLLMSTIKFIQP